MKKAILSFVVSIVLGFGLGYLVFGVLLGDSTEPAQVAEPQDSEETPVANAEQPKEQAETTAVADPNNILSSKGCLGCHAVESLGLEGGATGPDLSKAFENVEGKHGKPIDQFLTEPTSAVMSSVIGGSPLSDEELQQVVDLLKQASEK